MSHKMSNSAQNYEEYVAEKTSQQEAMWGLASQELQKAEKYAARLQPSLDQKWNAAFAGVKWHSNLGFSLTALRICVFLKLQRFSAKLREHIKNTPQYNQIENKFWKDNGTKIYQEFVEYD